MTPRTSLLALAGMLALATPALAQTQGVGKSEIVIGTIQDLSGPAAGLSKPALEGMQLRVEEVNEQGGINGRKLVLKTEDSGYDPKRAVLAAQKLIDQEKIFAMVGHLGTAPNIATFPVLFKKNVFSFFPLSAGRQMYEPLNRLTYAFIAPYYGQMRAATPRLAKEKGAKKVCAIYQDDDFGLEVLKGSEDGLKAAGMEMAEKVSYKRGATDFSSQVAKTKAAGCDLVVLGTIIRETIGAMGEARKSGFNPTFLASAAAYINAVPKLGGRRSVHRDDDRRALHRLARATRALLGQQVQDPVRQGARHLLGHRLRDHGRLHQGGAKGRPQPEHRQLRARHGEHDLPARHFRGAGNELLADQAPG